MIYRNVKNALLYILFNIKTIAFIIYYKFYKKVKIFDIGKLKFNLSAGEIIIINIINIYNFQEIYNIYYQIEKNKYYNLY